jgi:16S rRNA (guanine(966)-N(2))-methyltransferase RsmD
MRINSGAYKGKRIIAPKKLPVRPTTDFAKEALFNILNNRVEFSEISVLDLFAGTGNISYEFASRGTTNISCVDSNYGCVQFIQKTADELEMPLRTVKADVFKFIESSNQGYDIVFADPPYDLEFSKLESLVDESFNKMLVNKEGVMIVEHSKHNDLSSIKNFVEARRYGGSVFSFFKQ